MRSRPVSAEPEAVFRKCVLMEVEGVRYYCMEAVVSLFRDGAASIEPAEGHKWERVGP
jgi:hypothetical protein